MESVASSAVSSASTRNQIDKCIEVLRKALDLKKLVSLKIRPVLQSSSVAEALRKLTFLWITYRGNTKTITR